MAIRTRIASYDPTDSCNENNVFISNASYDTLYKLLSYVLNNRSYIYHPMYKNISSDISDDFIEIMTHMKEICKLINCIGDKYSEYRNSCMYKILYTMIYHTSHKTSPPFSSVLWCYTYDFNIVAPVKKYASFPVIDIILSTVCFRLSAINEKVDKLDDPTNKAIIIFDKAIRIFEGVLSKLQSFHHLNRTNVGNFISPKYRKYLDIFIKISEKQKNVIKGYMFNYARNIEMKSSIHIPTSSGITYTGPPEVELDLNIPISEFTLPKYNVNVAKINDGRIEIYEIQLSLSEIDNMTATNMVSTTMLLVINNKLTSLSIFFERNVYNDILYKNCGKYNLICVGYTICSDSNITFEKRLIEKNFYDLISYQKNDFSKFGMITSDYVTIVHDTVDHNKILIDKSAFDLIENNDCFYKFAPMLTNIKGNRFKITDILIHSATFANIIYNKYTSICMKPVITITSNVYYEFALVNFPLNVHLVNINICDPCTLISTNVVLDETTYFKLYNLDYNHVIG